MSMTKKQIAVKIRQLRRYKKMTNQQLADYIGVSFHALSSWLRERYYPTKGNIERLEELFELEGLPWESKTIDK